MAPRRRVSSKHDDGEFSNGKNRLPHTKKDLLRSLRRKRLEHGSFFISRRSYLIGLVVFSLYMVKRMFFPLSDHSATWFKQKVQEIWYVSEKLGLMERLDDFDTTSYHDLYPELKILEDNWKDIQSEVKTLLATDLAGGKDMSKIFGTKLYKIGWEALWFKMGDWIPENEPMAPKTVALLRNIDGLYNAFFSTLQPHQYLTPHFGIWRGYARYHLGLVVPGNNSDHSAVLRMQPSVVQQKGMKYSQHMAGAKEYYWHEGEGMLWDDTYLHDAENKSEQARTVLWLDIKRRDLPWYLRLWNSAALWVAHHESYVLSKRRQSVVGNPEVYEKLRVAAMAAAETERE